VNLLARASLSVRVAVVVAATVSAAVASYGVVSYREQRHMLADIATREAQAHAMDAAEACVDALLTRNYAALDELLLRLTNDPETTSILVARPDGTPLAEVRRDAEGVPRVMLSPQRRAPPPQVGVILERGEDEIVAWRPILAEGHVGWVRLATTLEDVHAAARAAKVNTLALVVLWSLAATVLLLLLLRAPVVSIEQLSELARGLGTRSGATASASSTAPEIVRLVEALNSASRELRESEARLVAERRLLQVTLGSIADGVVATDAAGDVVLANAAAEALAGCAPGAAVGRRFADLFPRPAGEDPRGPDPVEHVLAAGQPIHLGDRPAAPGPDGVPRTVAVGGAPLAGEGTTGAVLVLRDVTAQHVAEREHRDLQHAFEQAQKLESVGRLAGGVAHDFNNVLTVILGNLELALLTVSEDGPLAEPLREAREAAKGAASVTRQLLAFSRKSVIEPQAIDLAQALERLGKMLRRLIGEDVSLRVEPGDGARAWVDPGQLEQILINLVVNARDAMPRGGDLVIRTATERVRAGDPRLLPGTSPGEFAVLTVTDTGCGMTEEVRQHVFEPFFTTKEKGKGTGLGLATVYGAVRQNRGFIEVESEVGRGSTFRIYLPRSDARGPAANDPGVQPLRGGHETILLVEDEPAVRRLAARALEEAGYRVIACAGGEEALAAARRERSPIHLVVSDVVMPGMDGPTVVRELAAVLPSARVLYVSGYLGDANEVLEQLARKGVTVLPKPFTPATLSSAVRSALDAAA
jgi:PAS domain S-box-containing protein